ncbi:MAG: hypothetical protein M1596_05370, partial [Firmicutes bacterium]|nr:hypothetical protein [Bacillota bacterium]
TMDVTHSDIAIKLQRTEQIRDLAMVKDRLQRMALITTAAYGFSYGLGLDVEITKEIGFSTPPFIFGTPHEEIAFENSLGEMERYWRLISESPEINPHSRSMRIALINYMRAIRDPEEAMMFCYRAIEAVRDSPSFTSNVPTDHISTWNNLRTTLRLGEFEDYLKPLVDLATPHRHGEQMIPSHKEYIAGLKTTRTVIQRYAEYLNNEETALSPTRFPKLTQSEFNGSGPSGTQGG